ncbi:MAG: hypothetical protein J7539_17935, partial [Niabella sp.]|nr:hypothetical protein [Niabella sp.]
MKKLIATGFLLLLLHICKGQTNVFPADGNAGVGTTAPENSEGWDKVLEVKGNLHAKALVSSANIITGVWVHNTGFYGAPAGGMAGTYTNHPYSLITNKIARMTIATDGSVGIGTTVPTEMLELNGNVFINAENHGLIIDEGGKRRVGFIKYGGREGGVWRTANTRFEIGRVDVSALPGSPQTFTTDILIDGAGNVGVGTFNPLERLSVNGKI